ncbi:MAG: hypothetical protein N2441_03645 [Rhodocyclaceae bacterium]|nr:hypothetical protein [Rhodocyclaceae bacterium]
MTEYVFHRQRLIRGAPARVAAFFRTPLTWFRLNPEWEVLSFTHEEQLCVRYERSEAEVVWRVIVELDDDRACVAFHGNENRRIELSWHANGEGELSFEQREVFAEPLPPQRLAELSLWFEATVGYLALAMRDDWRARASKWLLDRLWLKLSPTARRVSLLVLAMEFLAFILFVGVLLGERWLG